MHALPEGDAAFENTGPEESIIDAFHRLHTSKPHLLIFFYRQLFISLKPDYLHCKRTVQNPIPTFFNEHKYKQ